MTNYKDKYLKYKKKYLELKGGLGKINLSGPTMISYYINPLTNKKIILMSDIHNSLIGNCDDNFTITQYIKQLYKESITNYNLFIEYDLDKKHLKIPREKIKDYITELINFGTKYYKTKDEFNIYFHDIRGIIPDINKFIDLEKPFHFYLENEPDYKNLLNIKKFIDFYLYQINNYNNWIFGLIDDTHFDKKEYNILNKELNKLKSLNQEYYNIIIEEFRKNIKSYKDHTLKIKQNTNNIEYMEIILDLIYKLGMIISSRISDIYLLSKLLTNQRSNNNIIYVGQAHYNYIHKSLINANYELIDFKKSELDQIRCINNIIPFDQFFLEY